MIKWTGGLQHTRLLLWALWESSVAVATVSSNCVSHGVPRIEEKMPLRFLQWSLKQFCLSRPESLTRIVIFVPAYRASQSSEYTEPIGRVIPSAWRIYLSSLSTSPLRRPSKEEYGSIGSIVVKSQTHARISEQQCCLSSRRTQQKLISRGVRQFWLIIVIRKCFCCFPVFSQVHELRRGLRTFPCGHQGSRGWHKSREMLGNGHGPALREDSRASKSSIEATTAMAR